MKKRANTTDTIRADLIALVAKKIDSLKAQAQLESADVMDLDRLCRIWESLRKEERELKRESALDDLAANDLDQYSGLIVDYLQRRTAAENK